MEHSSTLCGAVGLCVATACVILLGACGHDDGGQPHPAQWARTYGGASTDVANSVQATADGGYIIAGYTRSFGAGGADAWVLKLDANGNVIRQKTFGSPGTDEASSVEPTADGGYVAAGTTGSFGAGYADAWVLNLS